jgi:2-polyprenyl-3-methyl-5-hydroxy-6-metoxy-1,4-benzoquinol methylase
MIASNSSTGTTGTAIPYSGSELELFADARIWRAYWQAQIAPFIGKRVLEVGAGLGTVVRSLSHLPIVHWVALEPDPDMAGRLSVLSESGVLPAFCEPRPGTTSDLAPDEQFDTVMYVDVLEHIEDDRAELARAARHVAPNGTLIVLAPAHQFLYSSFDAAIGHFRRYRLGVLLDLCPPGLSVARARYLDAAGLLTSLGNRLLLKQSVPTPAQIGIWDRVMVRASRWIDPALSFRLGKSVLVVWRRS